ncbi:unnamed protein product [Rhodiola kirilowii]
MQHVIRRQPVQTKPCGFCAATDHRTDECPTLVEDDQAEVNAVGDYQGYGNRPGPVRQYGATTNNQGVNGQPWKRNNHQTGPNHQYQAQRDPAQQSTPQQTQEPYRHPHHQFQQNVPGQYQQKGPGNNQQGPNNHSPNKAPEDMIKDLASAVIQDRATTKGDIAELKKQMSQLNATVSDLASNLNTGRLPSQTIPNPKGNVSAVTLRSGRGASRPSEEESPQEPEEVVAEPDTYSQDLARQDPADETTISRSGSIPSAEASRPDPVLTTGNSNVQVPLPFPVQVRAPKKYVMDREVWELFSKVEINIPLLEAIKKIPRYSKYLKELCTNRRRGT